MLIRFNEISPHGNRITVREVQGRYLDENVPQIERGYAEFMLQRISDLKVIMQGQVEASVSLDCDRCLESFEYRVDAGFQILFETGSQDKWNVKELECSSEELDTIILEEPQINVDDTLRQQILLALPEKFLCSKSCKGLCGSCGVDLNKATCECNQGNPDSPFAILKKLKH